MPDPLVTTGIRGGVVEKFAPGDRTTWQVTAAQAASGGRMVAATAGQSFKCQTAGAGSLVCVGVALHDAAAGEKVTVAHEGVWLLRAAGAIVAGNLVECAANGEVRVLATVDAAGSFDPRAVVGRAMADIANGADGPVKLGL
jgi:predicted RecA/RadA family phage recombinase